MPARLLLLCLGALMGTVAVEVGLRMQMAFAPNGQLQRTATSFPPPYGDSRQANLGNLIRPSRVTEMVYELKPELDTRYFQARVTTNREGLRADQEYQKPKPAGVCRVLLLGDSQTFGQGVEFEQTFGQLLENELNSSRESPIVEVINSGVDGYNTAQEAAYLVSRGIEYEPDCIVILFIGNDLELPAFIDESKDPLAFDQSFLVNLLGDAIRRDRLSRVPERYRPMVGIEGYQRALRTIGKVAQERSIPVINLYDQPGRLAALYDSEAWDKVDQLQQQLGIIGHRIEMPASLEFWISDKNRHLNAKGHAVIAKQILGIVKAQVRSKLPTRATKTTLESSSRRP